MSRQLAGIFSIGHDPVKELSRHSGYGQAGRRKLGLGRDAGDLGRHGRLAAVDGWVYKRPCRKKTKTCFVYLAPSIFVPDTEKCPSFWFIHLRYETKNSLKNREKIT